MRLFLNLLSAVTVPAAVVTAYIEIQPMIICQIVPSLCP